MDQSHQFREVVVFAQKKAQLVESHGHPNYHLWPQWGEELHLIPQVFGPLAPKVEVVDRRDPVRRHHLAATAAVGAMQTRLNRVERVPDPYSVYLAGIGVGGPRRITVIGPLHPLNDIPHEIWILQHTKLDHIASSRQTIYQVVEHPLDEHLPVKPLNQCDCVDDCHGRTDLAQHPACIAKRTILVPIGFLGEFATDQSKQRAHSLDRFTGLVDRTTKLVLTIEEPAGAQLQLLHGDTLDSDSQRFRLAELQPGIGRNHPRIGGCISGQGGHAASVMSHIMRSAGLLPYRLHSSLEVMIAHPGGPFFAGRDKGAWSIVKGMVEDDEDDRQAAIREFEEETGWVAPTDGWVSLGETVLRSRKIVVVWAVARDYDTAVLDPGMFQMHGRFYPEIDRVEWMDPDLARVKLNEAQAVFIDRLELHLGLNGQNEELR